MNLNMILSFFLRLVFFLFFFLLHFSLKSGKCVDFWRRFVGVHEGYAKDGRLKMDEIHPPTKVIGGDPAGDRFLTQTTCFCSSLDRCHMKFPRISVGELWESFS